MKTKNVLITISVVLLILALILVIYKYNGGTFSLTSAVPVIGGTNVEIDTGLKCSADADCRSNELLPSSSYCVDRTCRFVEDTSIKTVTVNGFY